MTTNRLKHQVRFKTEEQILNAIDRTKANRDKWGKRADAHELSANAIYKAIAQEPDMETRFKMAANADDFRQEARRIRSYQNRYAQRLNRLKNTLAAFKTVAMPFVEESVVMQ